MTLPIWVLYLVLVLAGTLWLLALALAIASARGDRRQRRYGGDVTEAVAREIRFFDDQVEAAPSGEAGG